MCSTIRLTDDGHEGVEVSDVETLPGNINEELYHLGSLFLLRWLQKGDKVFISFLLRMFSLSTETGKNG